MNKKPITIATTLAELVIEYHEARTEYENAKYHAINRLSGGMHLNVDTKELSDLQRTMEVAEFTMLRNAKDMNRQSI